MTKYFNFNTAFNGETLNEFIDFHNTLSEEEDVAIVLASCGGEFWVLETLLEIINKDPDFYTIICSDKASSCGLYLLLFSKCDRIVTQGAWGLLHQSSREIPLNSFGKPYGKEALFHQNHAKVTLEFEKNLISEICTPSEQKEFLKGEDIFFDYKQLREFVKLNLNYEN